jgi:hypothetical protein
MNAIQADEMKKWEETEEAIKTMNELAYDKIT